jgi:hypothetical protein
MIRIIFGRELFALVLFPDEADADITEEHTRAAEVIVINLFIIAIEIRIELGFLL